MGLLRNSLQLENLSVCGSEPHAASWQRCAGNMLCLALVHWPKSEHPPDIWKSSRNVLWIRLLSEKMSRSYIRGPILGDLI